MTYELKRVDVWSIVKIAFLICAVAGLIGGLIYTIILSLIGGLLSMMGGTEFEEISGFFSGLFGFFVAFLFAFFYAVVGSIVAAILSWMYNLFARVVGGARLTFVPDAGSVAAHEQREEPLPASPQPSSS